MRRSKSNNWCIKQYLPFLSKKQYEPHIKYNNNAKYSAKDLKGGYNGNDFSVLDVYLKEKGAYVKTQLLNISKDHHIVAYSGP